MPFDPVRSALVNSAPAPRLAFRGLGRTLDLAIAVPALVLLAPLMLVVSLAILIEGQGPVLFRHQRVGFQDKRFFVLKFRTMCVQGDDVLAQHLLTSPQALQEWNADHKLRDDPRVSPLGKFLRKSSIDELPQLVNVIRGDMSIVGPRPIVEDEIVKYGAFFDAYCAVKPGITGIWQVSGRNDISYQRRVEMDALYARKKCVSLDLKIILATLPAVLSRRGSY